MNRFSEMCTIFRLFLGIFLTKSLLAVAEKETLYSDTDRLSVLNATHFEDTVVGTDNAWAVQFYNFYCGHCRHFAPTWKQIGKEVAGWHPVLRLGVVACNEDVNTPLCRHYDIKAYPTVKLLPARCRQDYTGEDYEGGMDRHELKQSLIDYIESYPAEKRAKACPALHPLKSLDDIWKDVTEDTKHTVVVFEEKNSYLGRQLQLDMVRHKQLVIRRMLKDDVKKFGVSRVPAMYLIDKGGTFKKLVESDVDTDYQRELHSLLGLQFTRIELEPELIEEEKKSKAEEIKAGALQYKSYMRVHQQDLMSGLHYTLRHEVAIQKHIDGEALTDLKNYCIVLAKYFPGPDYVSSFLSRVSEWVNGLDTLTGEQWLGHISDLQTPDAYLPASNKWTGCLGSSSRYRGYPCSLWMLFHALTVISVERDPQELSRHPQEVLIAMRGYIRSFFGCHECAVHFQKGAQHIEKSVETADDSILFLWLVHNRPNKFLVGDITEDPEHPKLQFPTNDMCPSCHVTKADGADDWDKDEVLKFIKFMYSESSIVQDAEYSEFQGQLARVGGEDPWLKFKEDNVRKTDLAKLAEKKSQKKSEEKKKALAGLNKPVDVQLDEKLAKWKQGEMESRYTHSGGPVIAAWGFNSIDISMCVLFYLLCTAIIVMLYFHFTVRKRRVRAAFLPV